MLAMIREEHVNIAKLLAVLKQKLKALRSEQPIRYTLIRDILDYLHTESDRFHHPKEDIIYEYYLRYRVVDDKVANRLREEHEKISAMTDELKNTVEMILLDAVIPQDQFADKLDEFIRVQERHMNYEEEQILPAIERSFTEDDWKQIEQLWKHSRTDDPLFGQQVAEQYRELAERIEGGADEG